MLKKKKKGWFAGFFDNWEWKLLNGILYMMLAFLVICLISVVVIAIPLSAVLIVLGVIAVSYTVGHFTTGRG